jgi:hypothetical protein
MPHPHRHRRGPKPDRRRALELLAASPDGCTEALMFANGFTAELLSDGRPHFRSSVLANAGIIQRAGRFSLAK